MKLGFRTESKRSELVTMEGQGGGSSTPSYSNMVSNRSKEASLKIFQKPMEAKTKTNGTQKPESSKSLEKEGIHKEVRKEMESGYNSRRTENISTIGPYKPKTNIKPQVVLNDPAL